MYLRPKVVKPLNRIPTPGFTVPSLPCLLVSSQVTRVWEVCTQTNPLPDGAYFNRGIGVGISIFTLSSATHWKPVPIPPPLPTGSVVTTCVDSTLRLSQVHPTSRKDH